jgi:antitoxin SocA-like protein
MRTDFDAQKFRELVLYVANKSADDPYFGATKLNKLLFFSDFLAYAVLGRPISGAVYEKQNHGPVPRELVNVRQQLIEDRLAVIQERRYLGYVQKRLIPLREPDLSRFSGEEVALIDDVIKGLSGRTASETSEFSHRAVPAWRVAQLGEEIPYPAAFLSTRPLTDGEIARAQAFATEHGFLVGQ